MKTFLAILLIFFSLTTLSQPKWHPYLGLHVSMDAEGYYVGPSAQIGINYQLKKRFVLSSYFHYFPKRVDKRYRDGSFEHGRYRSMIAALLAETNYFKKNNRGILLAGGIAVQHTYDNYTSTYYDQYIKRTILVAALRVGYSLPAWKESIISELNATGPHIGKKGPAPYYEQIIEILTQLSLGMRLVF